MAIRDRLMRWHREESGQTIILGVLLLFLFIPLGGVVFDVGLIVNDRRVAQNAADKAALAGAQELTLSTQGDGGWSNAEAAARQWLLNNDVPQEIADAASITPATVDDCFPDSSVEPTYPVGVRVDFTRAARGFLVDTIQDWSGTEFDWQVRGDATACAGRVVAMTGMLPFALSETGDCFENGEPRYGEFCEIRFESGSGLWGVLNLGDENSSCYTTGGGSGSVQDNIKYGAQVTCRIGDSVRHSTGNDPLNLRGAVRDRLASGDGECAQRAPQNGVSGSDFAAYNSLLNSQVTVNLEYENYGTPFDDIFEIWQRNEAHPEAVRGMSALDCGDGTPDNTSPRNGVVIIVRDAQEVDPGAGAQGHFVRGFARIYIEGCSRDEPDENRTSYPDHFSKGCDYGPGGGAGGNNFTLLARFIDTTDNEGELGLEAAFGDIGIFLAR